MGETMLIKRPPSKSRPEMPRGEFENLLRFKASRRKERRDVINKNDIGRNEWLKTFNLQKGKGKAPLTVP